MDTAIGASEQIMCVFFYLVTLLLFICWRKTFRAVTYLVALSIDDGQWNEMERMMSCAPMCHYSNAFDVETKLNWFEQMNEPMDLVFGC